MRKLLYYIAFVLAVLTAFSSAQAQKLLFYSADASKYPIISAKFFKVDEKGTPDNSWDKSSAQITESGELKKIISFECPDNQTLQNISSVLTIDLSESMSGDGLQLAKAAAIEWINFLNIEESECALTSFNTYSSINRDFTRDREKLVSSVNSLRASGGTNFDKAFLDTLSGALVVAKRGRLAPVIVFLTDGIAEPDYKLISSKANAIGAKIYTVVLNLPASDMLKELSRLTGGAYYDNIKTDRQIKEVYQSILLKARGAEPCTVSWLASGCAIKGISWISVSGTGLTDDIDYVVDPSKLPALDVDLSMLSTDFSVVIPPLTSSKDLSIKALNDDIRIDSIYCDNPLFIVTTPVKGHVISKNGYFNISIDFRPIDTNFTIGKLLIFSSACKYPDIFLAGGSSENASKTLKLNFPNGGEMISSLADTLITWSGVLPKDTVKIEFSTDGGDSWNIVADKAGGLLHKWKTPDLASDKCLIKVKKLSKTGFYEKVVVFDHKRSTSTARWNSTGDLIASGDEDGNVKIWNSYSGELAKIFRPADSPIKDLAWSQDDQYIAIQLSDLKISIFDYGSGINIADLESPVGRVTSMKWSPDGTYFIGGTSQGTMHVWKSLNKLPFSTIKLHDSLISTMEWSPDKKSLATGAFDGSVKIWREGDFKPVQTLYQSTGKIFSLSWSQTGVNLVFADDINGMSVYDVEKSSPVMNFYVDTLRIKQLAWSADKRYIAATSGDNLISLWDPSTGKIQYSFDGAQNSINCIEWNRFGDRIAGADSDGHVMVWYYKDFPFEKKIVEEDISDKVWTLTKPFVVTSNITFPATLVNDSKDQVVKRFILNNGKARIKVDSIYVMGDSKSMFKVNVTNFPIYIEAGDQKDINITFQPSKPGLFLDTIYTVTSVNKYSNNIFGEGVTPKLKINPEFLDFGIIPIETTSKEKILEITNLTSKDIRVDSIRYIGPNIDQFPSPSPTGFVVQANSTFKHKIVFQGLDKGRASSTIGFYYKEDKMPLTAHLFGECTASDPRMQSNLSMPIKLCSTGPIDTTLILENLGNNDLIVKYLTLQSDFFKIIDPVFGFTLSAGDTQKIKIRYNPQSPGTHPARLVLKTNKTAQTADSVVCLLEGLYNISSFEISRRSISFDDLDEFQEGYDTLFISNKGTVKLQWDFPIDIGNFQIADIFPDETLPGDSSRVIVRFKGGKADTLYSASFDFKDKCGNVRNVLFQSFLGKSNSIFSSAGILKFNRILCESDTAERYLTVKNTGTSTLTIRSINIDLSSDKSFTVEHFPLSILADSTDSIRMRFTANQAGTMKGKALIKTNSSNSDNGFIKIDLESSKDISKFSIEPLTIEMANIPENEKDTASITVENIGTTNLYWGNLPDSARFRAINPIPSLTLPGKSTTIQIVFKGGMPTEVVKGSLDFSDSCGQIVKVEINAKVRGMAQTGLMVPDIKGQSGDIVGVSIMKYKTPQSELPIISGFETVLEYNASLLEPVGSTPKGTILNGKRIIPLKLDNIIEDSGLLAEYTFRVTIGDTVLTKLSLRDSKALNDKNIYVETKPGIFSLNDTDIFGGKRIVKYTGKLELSQNRPNPSDQQTLIWFWLIEKGYTELSLYDIRGNKLKVLYAENAKTGYNEVLFSTKDLPVGSYIYRLQTPTQFLIKKMDIIR